MGYSPHSPVGERAFPCLPRGTLCARKCSPGKISATLAPTGLRITECGKLASRAIAEERTVERPVAGISYRILQGC